MWYCQASRIGPVVIIQPTSSVISRATQLAGSSPSSSLPPGSSHSSRSLRSNRTWPSRMTTPLTETGNSCGWYPTEQVPSGRRRVRLSGKLARRSDIDGSAGVDNLSLDPCDRCDHGGQVVLVDG